MKNDWDSLFFSYRPHNDQSGHDDRLLRDVGLTRTATGDLAWAEDPTHLIPRHADTARHLGWLRTLRSFFTPADQSHRQQQGFDRL